MLNKKNIQKGFIFIEVIMVIAIISILTAISFVSWQSFSDQTNLGNTAKLIESKIKLAKNYSLSSVNDKNYGIRFKADSVVLFPADVAYIEGGADNQVFDLTDGVEIYGAAVGTDIIFSRLTGVADAAKDIDIRITVRLAKTKTVTINSQGQTGTAVFGTSTISPINNARHTHFILNSSISDISTLTVLRLKWVDKTTSLLIKQEDIDVASHFSPGKFEWSGTVAVGADSQPIRIHSWIDTDSGKTVLCVMRDETENQKLIIYFDVDKEIGTYAKNDITGAVDLTKGAVYVDTMDPQ